MLNVTKNLDKFTTITNDDGMRFKEACKAQDHYWMDRITRLTDGGACIC